VLHLGVDFKRHGVTFKGKAHYTEEVGHSFDIERFEVALESWTFDMFNCCGPHGENCDDQRCQGHDLEVTDMSH